MMEGGALSSSGKMGMLFEKGLNSYAKKCTKLALQSSQPLASKWLKTITSHYGFSMLCSQAFRGAHAHMSLPSLPDTRSMFSYGAFPFTCWTFVSRRSECPGPPQC